MMEADQYTAKNAIPNEDRQEDTSLAGKHSPIIHNLSPFSVLAPAINNNRQKHIPIYSLDAEARKGNAYWSSLRCDSWWKNVQI